MTQDEMIKIAEEIKDRTPMFFGKIKPLIPNKEYDVISWLISVAERAGDVSGIADFASPKGYPHQIVTSDNRIPYFRAISSYLLGEPT